MDTQSVHIPAILSGVPENPDVLGNRTQEVKSFRTVGVRERHVVWEGKSAIREEEIQDGIQVEGIRRRTGVNN